MKTWQSYLFSELFKTFLWVLSGVFGLFVLLDYSIHVRQLSQNIDITAVTTYYLCHLSKYGVVLIPLSLLIATSKVMISLNMHKELVALQAGGLPIKKIAHPFLISAILLCCILYINFQWWMPLSMERIDLFEEIQFGKAQSANSELNLVPLEDGSKLYYQRFFPNEMALFDVFWIQNPDEMWRIKSLKLSTIGPEGFCVDHLKRNAENQMELVNSYEYIHLKQMRVDTLASRPLFVPFRARSITGLIDLVGSATPFYAQKQSAIISQLLYKLCMPLGCILVVWGVFPPCARYSRQLKPTLIYSLGLFGFIAGYAVIGAALILGDTNTISPYLALLIPMGMTAIFFGGRFHWI